MTTSRGIRANRRRWSQPVPVLRFPGPLSAELADVLKRRYLDAVRHRRPIIVGSDFEVIR